MDNNTSSILMTILSLNAYNNYYIWLIVTNEDNLSVYSRNSFSI